MNAFIRKTLFSEPTGPPPGFRYVILTLLLILLAIEIWLVRSTRRSFPYPRYDGLLLVLAILFTHLTEQFRWPRRIFISLRVLAYASMLSLLICLLYSVPAWFAR
jgi:hypothetical protein